MSTSESRREFAALLNNARRERHLSIRAAARLADVPAGTVQGWLNGKHFPVAALRPNYLRLVDALGLSNQVPADLWSEVQPLLRTGPAPYLGLRPFTAADRDYYFGRGRESRRLAEVVHQQWRDRGSGIIVVLGASGAGKSSLLAAGLIGHESVEGLLSRWTVEAASVADLPRLGERHSDLLVIDQFEDVFALDPGDRSAAMAGLSSVAARSVVVLGMRADAFAHASKESVLVNALEHPFLISAMTRQEARDVIVGPAELAGVAVDEALVSVLLDDLSSDAGDGAVATDVLPLLSNSLLVTWAAGRGSRISLNDYLDSGGVAKALQMLADEVFASLEPVQQEAAQALFLRLVKFSGDNVARRSVPLDEIVSAGRVAMDAFVAARMLTVAEGVVRISHEAMLRHWPRLREWIDAARVDLTVVGQLRGAARVWDDSGRSSDALIPVERLEVFSEWMGDPKSLRLLGPLEREFVAASRDHFTSRLSEERAVNTRLRRGRRLAVVLTALVSVLALVASVLYLQSRSLQAQTDIARLESQSRQIALEAQYLRADDPNQMAQMSLVGADLAQTRQSLSTLVDATSVNVPIRWLGPGGAVIAQSPDSSIVARAGGKGAVTIWRGDELTRTPGASVQVDPSEGPLFALALAQHDGQTLLAVGGAMVAQLWDVTEEPRLVADLWQAAGVVKSMAFDQAGETLAVGNADGSVALWSVPKDDMPRLSHTVMLPPSNAGERDQVWAVALSPAGTTLYAGGAMNTITRWSLRGRPKQLSDLTYDYNGKDVRVQALAVSPRGDQLTAGLQGRQLRRWRLDRNRAEPLPSLPLEGWTNTVSYSPDGKTLLVGNSSQNVYLFDAVTGADKGKLFDAHNVTGALWVRDRVVSVEEDGGLRVWQKRTVSASAGSVVYGLSNSGDDRLLAAATLTDGVLLWRREDEILTPLPRPALNGRTISSAIAFAPNGRFLIGGTTAANHGELITWSITESGTGNPSFLQGFGKQSEVGMAAVSPDSTLVAATEYVGKHVALFTASESGELERVATMEAPLPQAVAFSADGTLLAVPLADEKTQLWDVTDPHHPLLAGTIANPGAPASAVAFSPLGHVLAVGSGSGEISLWNIDNPADPVRLRSYRDAVAWINMVRFSPDGAMLAAAGGDKFIWVWNVDAPSDAAQLALSARSPRTWDLRFLDGGRELIAVGDSAEVRSWLVRTNEAKAMLCATRGDPLTADEWARYLPGVPVQDPC